MRRTLTSISSWAGRGWAVIGLVLVAFVALEGLYRGARRVRNRPPSAPVATDVPRNHPYAGRLWFNGWYEQPVVRAGIVYDPYRAFHKAPARTPLITVDSGGRRVTVQPSDARGARRRLFLLGGSTMWGYTARDSLTIPSLVASELRARGLGDIEVVNLAQPGYNATQEVITLFLALRDGDVPAAAVFLTTHKDIAAAFQTGRAGGITSQAAYGSLFERQDPSFSDELESVVRRSALIARLSRPARARTATRSVPEPSPGVCTDVAHQYRELARLTASMGREYGFSFIFLRQPLLATSKKPLSEWERTMERSRYDTLFRHCMKIIDSTMQRAARGNYASLASVFDADTSSVFLDEYGYLTEQAGGVIARRIVELVEPSLRRSQPAASR